MATEPVPAADLTYSSALSELDALIAELDAGSVDIDTLEKRFKRAIEIVENLDARILRTRSQVEELIPRLDSVAKQAKSNGPE